MAVTANSNTVIDGRHAVIALGANVAGPMGSPADTLRKSVAALSKLSQLPVRCSSFWRSAYIPSPNASQWTSNQECSEYINAVGIIRPLVDFDPLRLLRALQNIEQQSGRLRDGSVDQPRPLDLDIIAFDRVCCNEEQLILPHPRAAQRRFVLEPLAEVLRERAADYCLPGSNTSIKSLLQQDFVRSQKLEKIVCE